MTHHPHGNSPMHFVRYLESTASRACRSRVVMFGIFLFDPASIIGVVPRRHLLLAQEKEISRARKRRPLPDAKGEFLYLLFVAPDSDFNALWPAFEHMLYSFQPR